MTRPTLTSAITYFTLLKSIRTEIDSAQKIIQTTQAESYWKIGKAISDYILEGADRAKYGENLYQLLEKDLRIDADTLRRVVRFSKEFPISAARRKLPWSHYRTLLSVTDRTDRQKLIQKSIRQKFTSRELQKEIDRYNFKAVEINAPIPQLKFERGTLYTCEVLEPVSLQAVDGTKFVDCGFETWRQIPAVDKFKDGDIVESEKTDSGYRLKKSKRSATDLYTFKATIERIVDGDTLIVHVDLGFDTWTRQKLRFRGIDCPELSTPEGQRTKRFIESRIKPNDFVIIKTHKSDKYDRYLVDVFYLAGEKDETKVASEGIYLNQELLDNRQAVKW